MNLQEAKSILNKINDLHRSIAANDETISAIERDMMLMYLRQMYDLFLNEKVTDTYVHVIKAEMETKKVTEQIFQAPPTPTPVPKPQPAPIVVPEPPKVVVQPTPPPPPQPVVTATPKVEEKVVIAAPQVEPIPTPAPHPVVQQPTKKVETKSSHSPYLAHDNEGVLFDPSKGGFDVNDRLLETPIADLRKMGLNDRILIMNELFNGDQNTFEEALNRINGFSTFEEAQDYIKKRLLDKYDWNNKLKTAKVFLKLIRRRFM